ncbi:MAG: caspase family protein [Rhodobacteraceae bacterium]|jgi:TPR repeat protein|nr:caspase family protein [Paracoccaceae bacterium]
MPPGFPGLMAALTAVVTATLTLAPPALALTPLTVQTRIAIVVGNEDYATAPDLPNAGRDAADMAALLDSYGFTVFSGTNLDRRGFETLLREAMLNTPEGADVVFFYAGHGIQIGRRNYLLPVDAVFESVHDLPTFSIVLDRVIEALASRGATHLAIIDACRENPFPNLRLAADLDANIFEAQSGFEVVRTPLNSLVAFSTSPGEVALDGPPGANSPYTEAVLAAARSAPEESVLTLFAQVREQVHAATAGRQVPWESSTLVRPFTLFERGQVHVVPVQATVPQDAPTEPRASDPVTLPASAFVTLPLDRQVALADRIADALGQPLIAPALVTPPDRGGLTVSQDGADLFYRPDFEEVRATGLDGFRHEDTFRIETGPPGQRAEVEVRLTLQALACDLQAGDGLDLQGVGLWRLPNEIAAEAALQACQSAVAAAPDAGRFHYQLGRALQATGDLEAAFASFTRAADLGHVRALNAQAFLMLTPRVDRTLFDIPADAPAAHALLDRAIAAGDAYAMHARGQRLLRDGPTDADRSRGWELLNRAAELGHTYSMNELGVTFLRPDGGRHIPERGLAYLNASAARDDIYGWDNLGRVALNGWDGNPPDPARARDWFVKAAEGGHPFAPSELGRMIVAGKLGDPDWAAAVRWYDMGLSRGDGWGGANAAWLIVNRDVPGFTPADAAVRAAKAVHLPDAGAADQARGLLARLDARTLDAGTQTLLNDLGAGIEVDGAFGPGSRAALAAALAAAGVTPSAATPEGRLLDVARASWATRPVRADLF